jgi:hypothetical protein
VDGGGLGETHAQLVVDPTVEVLGVLAVRQQYERVSYCSLTSRPNLDRNAGL